MPRFWIAHRLSGAPIVPYGGILVGNRESRLLRPSPDGVLRTTAPLLVAGFSALHSLRTHRKAVRPMDQERLVSRERTLLAASSQGWSSESRSKRKLG
jgi:hypothetical protein